MRPEPTREHGADRRGGRGPVGARRERRRRVGRGRAGSSASRPRRRRCCGSSRRSACSITSFRDADLVNTTGWWTTLAHPFRPSEWTLENYRSALDAAGLPERVPQQRRGGGAGHGHADRHRRLRRLRVLVDGVPGPPRAVRARRRADGRAAADGAHPDPAALHAAAPAVGSTQVIPDLDLNGTFLGVWLAHTGFGLPLATYLLRNYIGSLPSSIIESARIDGADHFTIFWRLVIPLSVPALAAFAIFQFLWVWNDLLVAYVFLGGTSQNRVLTIALQGLNGAHGEDWHLLTSAAFITMALPLIVFFSLQRYFVRGLTAGLGEGVRRAAFRSAGAVPAVAEAQVADDHGRHAAARAGLLGAAGRARRRCASTRRGTSSDDVGTPALHRVRPGPHPVRVHRARLHVRAPAGAGRRGEGDGPWRCSSASRCRRSRPTRSPGIVAGVGAGGLVAPAPRARGHGWKPRAVGVLVAAVYTFVLVRTAGALALLPAPVFPLTALGLADHYVDWRRQSRSKSRPPPVDPGLPFPWAPVAQRIERLPSKQRVAGSSPAGGALA